MELKKHITIIVLIIIVISLVGYLLNRTTSNLNEGKEKRVWVYVEMKTTLPRDTSDYFYFGQINKSILNMIDRNYNVDGLFVLSDIRFWNNDDLLQVYENEDDLGYKIFHIQDIQYLSALKKDPVFKYEINELHESCKEIRFNE